MYFKINTFVAPDFTLIFFEQIPYFFTQKYYLLENTWKNL